MAKSVASLLLLSLCPVAKAQSKKPPRACPLVFEMHKDGGSQQLNYASSHPLHVMDTTVKTLLVYIHGINRNGVNYFEYAEDMVRSAKQKKQTLVIAPQYPHAEDLDYNYLGRKFLYWKGGEWKDGYESITSNDRPQSVGMSSYEVLDSLLTSVLTGGKFPGIKTVVIAGHSAGGQFVQRYSATTPMPELFPSFAFRFMIMDPSSYMYMDNKRPGGDGTWSAPDSSACPAYNHYPKGLQGLNAYASAMGADNIRHNILHRDIIILLGGQDTRMDDPNLDITCGANLQGPFRLERGQNYIIYLNTFAEYGGKKNFSIVADSGHDGDKMINSDEARKWIYGDGGRP